MNRIYITIAVLASLAFFAGSCSEEGENASLIGSWQGTTATIEFYPTGSPVAVYEETDEDFNTLIEFRDDGTARVEDEGTITEGTWEYADGNKKIVASVDLQNEFFGASETFSISQLTSNVLILDYDKTDEFDIPDFGQVSGRLKLTLHFDRVN